MWINAKEKAPEKSGSYLIATHHDSPLIEGGYWISQVIMYSAEEKGWNTFVGDENRDRHEMFPDFWMPIPEYPY